MSIGHRRSRSPSSRTVAGSMLVALALASCGPANGTLDDAGLINNALLKTLTAQGKHICVDRATVGDPLVIFRTMLQAPDPTRRILAWYAPRPLDDGRDLTRRELVGAELHRQQIVIGERADSATPLPLVAQVQLNALAKAFSLIDSDHDVTVRANAAAPLATVRWWLRNRLDPDCVAPYAITRPVIAHDVAFASVTSGHRGTTYAFHRVKSQWQVVASWSDWLY